MRGSRLSGLPVKIIIRIRSATEVVIALLDSDQKFSILVNARHDVYFQFKVHFNVFLFIAENKVAKKFIRRTDLQHTAANLSA